MKQLRTSLVPGVLFFTHSLWGAFRKHRRNAMHQECKKAGHPTETLCLCKLQLGIELLQQRRQGPRRLGVHLMADTRNLL